MDRLRIAEHRLVRSHVELAPGDEDHVGRTLARAARGERDRRKAEDQGRSHTGETDGDRPTPRRGHR